MQWILGSSLPLPAWSPRSSLLACLLKCNTLPQYNHNQNNITNPTKVKQCRLWAGTVRSFFEESRKMKTLFKPLRIIHVYRTHGAQSEVTEHGGRSIPNLSRIVWLKYLYICLFWVLVFNCWMEFTDRRCVMPWFMNSFHVNRTIPITALDSPCLTLSEWCDESSAFAALPWLARRWCVQCVDDEDSIWWHRWHYFLKGQMRAVSPDSARHCHTNVAIIVNYLRAFLPAMLPWPLQQRDCDAATAGIWVNNATDGLKWFVI